VLSGGAADVAAVICIVGSPAARVVAAVVVGAALVYLDHHGICANSEWLRIRWFPAPGGATCVQWTVTGRSVTRGSIGRVDDVNKHWTNRSRVLVGIALVVVLAAVAASQGKGLQLALFVATIAYCLLIVGVSVGTVFLYRGGSRRTKQGMATGLGLFAVLGAIGAATSTDGQAIVFIVEMFIGMAVVDLVVLAVRFQQRRRGQPQESPGT
jgi:peptidoglycan/LPS O-acetylase OafA/YrhL